MYNVHRDGPVTICYVNGYKNEPDGFALHLPLSARCGNLLYYSDVALFVYMYVGGGEDKPKFGPNLNEFVQRFDAATTKGQGESVCR